MEKVQKNSVNSVQGSIYYEDNLRENLLTAIMCSMVKLSLHTIEHCHGDMRQSGGIAQRFLTSALCRGQPSASCPYNFTPGMGPRAILDTMEKRKLSCPCWESNRNHSPSLWQQTCQSPCWDLNMKQESCSNYGIFTWQHTYLEPTLHFSCELFWQEESKLHNFCSSILVLIVNHHKIKTQGTVFPIRDLRFSQRWRCISIMTPCSFVGGYQYFRRICFLHSPWRWANYAHKGIASHLCVLSTA
jgi:hypothetical protein